MNTTLFRSPTGLAQVSRTALIMQAIQAGNRFAKLAEGSVLDLGIGFDPTEEQEINRRAHYARLAAHLRGPLTRKVVRAKSHRKMQAAIWLLARFGAWEALNLGYTL